MRNNLLLLPLLFGCSSFHQGAKVATWTKPTYDACEPVILNAPPFDVGITVYRADLKHRYDVFNSMRPYLVHGTSYTQIGAPFEDGQHSQVLAGFDANGDIYYNQIWEEPQNAMWEEASEQFNFRSLYYRADVYRGATNLTATSDSFYNVGIFGIPGKIGYGALIEGDMRPHSMNFDGTDKKPIASTDGFAYGFQSSPDGTHYAFHSHYQVYIGNYTTGVENHVQTPCSFNFLPQWSDDSQRIAFFCGSSNNSPDVWVSDRMGNAHFVGNRGSYSGVAPIMDGHDFHGGGSDFVAWWGQYMIYAVGDDQGVQLIMRNPDDGVELQLTATSGLNYYPTVRDHYLLFNSTRSGTRNVYWMDLETFETKQLTNLQPGCGVYNIKWSPK